MLRKTPPIPERTIIATVLPSNVGAGDNIPLLLPNCEADLAACLLGNLNSLIVDFVDRVKQSGVHASFFIVKQLPILSPQQYTQRDIDFITNRIAKLTRNSEEINKIWLIDKPCYRFQQPKERLRIRAELDAYYAKLYGLTRDELRYILDPER